MGDDGGVQAEGRGQHRGAEHDALGAGQNGRHPAGREGGLAIGMFPGLEMVGDEDGIEAGLFGLHGKAQQIVGCELLR